MRVVVGVLLAALSSPAMSDSLDDAISLAMSQYGVSCSDLRRLTAVERREWVERLGLSDEVVRRVRERCSVRAVDTELRKP